MICSSCKQTFPDTATFCPFCGGEVPRHITTKMGGLAVDIPEQPDTTDDVHSEWETLVDGFGDDSSFPTGPREPISGESEVRPPPSRRIIAETVILAEDPDAVEATPFNRTMVNELVRESTDSRTAELAPLESFQPWKQHLVKGAVAAGLALAIGGGVVVGSWLAERVDANSSVAEDAVATASVPAADAVEHEPPELGVRPNGDAIDVSIDDEVVHTISSVEGSRYESLEARARSIEVRLEHVAGKSSGRFKAVVAGDHWELVHRDDGSDFRILDVTRTDAESMGGQMDVVTQLLADRLNAAFGPSKPNS